MSRAMTMSVAIVSGLRFFTSRPQASPECISAVPDTASAAAVVPARKLRLSRPAPSFPRVVVIGIPPFCAGAGRPPAGIVGSVIASVLLQDLDLVAVGILHEEKAGHQRPVAEEFLDRVWLEA